MFSLYIRNTEFFLFRCCWAGERWGQWRGRRQWVLWCHGRGSWVYHCTCRSPVPQVSAFTHLPDMHLFILQSYKEILVCEFPQAFIICLVVYLFKLLPDPRLLFGLVCIMMTCLCSISLLVRTKCFCNQTLTDSLSLWSCYRRSSSNISGFNSEMCPDDQSVGFTLASGMTGKKLVNCFSA